MRKTQKTKTNIKSFKYNSFDFIQTEENCLYREKSVAAKLREVSKFQKYIFKTKKFLKPT